LAPRFFEDNRPSELASRMTSDTGLIEQVVGTTVSVALRNTFTGIGGLIYLFTLSPKLAGMLALGIPVVIMPIVLLGRRVRNYSRTSQDRVADVGSIAVETLGAMKIVQAFGQEEREAARFRGAVDATFAAAKRRIRLRAVMTALVIGLIFGSITMVIWEGVVDVQAGRMTGGAIFAFVLTGGFVASAFGSLTEVYGDLLRGAGAAGRLAELLREVPEIRAPANPTALPLPARGGLEFDHVEFRYPSRRDVAALHDFSLVVEPGDTVAVVGPSGAGKTTLFQLIQRFYDPDEGRVLIDGIPLPEADPAEIRARIAMVPQETVIFGASARDNLRYGDWGASDEALWAAAEAANAAEFLRKLPEGLDTFLGEGGARLSGGQRQRVAIARALLRDAPILLLDEATSALDAESERLVQQALDRLMENRTTLVIAHRLATVRAASRIIVMNEGRIVESGTHQTLIGDSGLYARLASLQFNEAA
jgi:ATP-binding cassette subfamily B protein